MKVLRKSVQSPNLKTLLHKVPSFNMVSILWSTICYLLVTHFWCKHIVNILLKLEKHFDFSVFIFYITWYFIAKSKHNNSTSKQFYIGISFLYIAKFLIFLNAEKLQTTNRSISIIITVTCYINARPTLYSN